MKHLKIALLTATALGLTSASITATAGQGCVTCGGYFYTAVSYTNTYGVPNYTYASRGPYSTEDNCWQAVNNDYGNSDGWLPFEGSPKCTYRYENNYEAYDDIIKDWNTGSNGNGDNNGGVIANEEIIAEIKDLRKAYDLEAYEAKLNRLISPITDPNHDEDEYSKVRR